MQFYKNKSCHFNTRISGKLKHWQRHPSYFFCKMALGIFIVFTAISFISTLLFTGIVIAPLPFAWYTVIEQKNYAAVMMAVGVIVYMYVMVVNYRKAGIYRWYALNMLIAACLIILSIWVGLVIFKFWSHLEKAPNPWQLIVLLDAMPLHSTVFLHLVISLLLGVGAVAVFIIFHLLHKNSDEKKILGNAHFASPREINKAGFFSDDGIIVGKSWDKPLKAGGFEHVLVFAPAGSGKSTAIAIPNLLTWEQSCVVNDTKYELFELTSAHRQKKFNNAVFLWAPTRLDGKTHRYNPLKFISSNPHKRISEIQLMGHVLIPNGQGDPIWYQSSRELFLGLVLYLLDSKEHTLTFAEIYNLAKQYKFNRWLQDLVENTTHYDPEFYRNASSYLNSGEKTRASILKTFTGYLEVFANPVINAATSDSDFDIRDLRKNKMTIYIGFPDNEKEMLSPLLTLFWQQLIGFMTEKLPNEKNEPYALLCLMDEFSALGRLVNLKNSLKILRGYRVRVIIILQYIAQTLEIYSKAEAESFKNIKTKVCFALDSLEDAEYVSRLLGMQTKKITSKSYTQHIESSSTANNYQLQSLPLIRPDEIQGMKARTAIIMRTGHPPVKAKQYVWYKQQDLIHLPCGEVDVPVQTPVILPFDKEGDTAKMQQEKIAAEERVIFEEKENARLAHEKELEKIKLQAEILASVVIDAVRRTNNKEAGKNSAARDEK